LSSSIRVRAEHPRPLLADAWLAFTCLWAGFAQAEDKPLWEAGLGVAVIDFPDYRGADERQTFVLPLPYFIYRGDVIQADRDGARGRFFRNDRLDLSLSFNGSIPVDSSDNEARRGMPDLDPTLEIGPKLEIKLLRDKERSVNIGLVLPVRTVIATDFSHTKNVGWAFEPRVDFDFRDTWLGEGWNVGLDAGPLFGDKRYHNYFHGVPAQFATAQRPAFVADGGYGGVRGLLALSRKFPSFWFGAFMSADTLAGSEIEASPVTRQKESYAAGFAITWKLGQSDRMVTVDD
jgi:outer membrane scaffolding protein for murein synthesis (MipA/OmpV family)